ncbi:MAG: L-histidine N(alpha)-methyltransferase [Bacteroidota bacterium]
MKNNISEFAEAVKAGLSQMPKKVSSRYFYDAKGSELFREIMKLPEYYLTGAEYSILDRYKHDLLQLIIPGKPALAFELADFGAGDGLKTKLLLDAFLKFGANFSYVPIDISADALKNLRYSLETEMPELKVKPLNTDYFSALEKLDSGAKVRKAVLFLGSNIGNFTNEEAAVFLKEIHSRLNPGDIFICGFDLKKNPDKIKAAYNDSKGITSAFNLNLLTRMNRELGSNFDLSKFRHYPSYDPVTGEARSALLSIENQTIIFKKPDFKVDFEAWEVIQTELSRKYSAADIEKLSLNSGFRVLQNYLDAGKNFCDSVWVA